MSPESSSHLPDAMSLESSPDQPNAMGANDAEPKPAPSQRPSVPTTASEVVHRVMQANKRANTKPEQLVRAMLRQLGFPGYRLQWKKCPGHPDIAYPGRKIAIFVNGCFWHCCPICNMPHPKINQDYWEAKFARNRERDTRTRQQLEDLGWTVVNIWEHELKNDRAEATGAYLYEVVSLDDPDLRREAVARKDARDEDEARHRRHMTACMELLKREGLLEGSCNHKQVTTMEQAKRLEKRLGCSIAKNLLLKEKTGKRRFLYSLPGDARADLRTLADQAGCGKLTFADDQELRQLLDVEPGCVSVLDLLNDGEAAVELLLDSQLKAAEFLGFHPLLNTTTVKLRASAVFRELPELLGHEARVVSAATDNASDNDSDNASSSSNASSAS